MADKTYRLTFNMTDGSQQYVDFTVPQGETGASGSTDDYITIGTTEPASGPMLWFDTTT